MKHSELIEKMSLKQKVALLSGRDVWSTYPFPSLNIPAMYMSDGPHGVRKQAGEGDHLGLNASLPATCFPTAVGVASSWDPAVAALVGRTVGEEAAVQQVNVLLGPGLNTKRSPLGGRDFEYYSEDPYLAGKMAASMIRGIQENGISACPKHFAVNSQELLRMSSDSILDERTLRELYLTNFEIAVTEGKPRSLMSSYNRVNGVYANDSEMLLNDILRKTWGFDGYVVTDWGGSNDHVQAVRAGSNLEMPGTGGDSDLEVLAAIENGSLSMDDLNARVDELLDVILSTHAGTENAAKEFDVDAHHNIAREVAGQTAVLLKNDGVLPLAAGTRVAVIGDMAITPRYQGAGSSVVNPTKLDMPVDMLQASELEVVGTAQGYLRSGKSDTAMQAAAVELAKTADIVLLYMGLTEISESEGVDREHMHLPKNQEELLAAVTAVNPNVVVVMAGGSPVEIPWLDSCRALVHGYLCGQAGAGAMVDILTGKICPSGKLAETWPLVYADTPNHRFFPGRQLTAEYREGLFVGYRYYSKVGKNVRFPFGYGLSYTTFEYSDLKADASSVTFTLTNTGKVAGAEAAQLYVACPNSQIPRPGKELKGFAKVELQPGESKQVTIELDDKAFRYWNVKTGKWEIEGGKYTLQVGASSEDIRLSETVELAGTDAPLPYDANALPNYFAGKVEDLSDAEFETLLGRSIPQHNWDKSQPLSFNDSLSQLFYAKNPLARFVGKILAGMKAKSEEKGEPNLNVLFIYNMPFRGLAKMTGGMVTTEMAHSLLDVVNGHFFSGMGKTISEYFKGQKALKERKKGL